MINVMITNGKFVGQIGQAKFMNKDTVVFYPKKKNEKIFLLAEDVTVVTSKPKSKYAV